MTGEEARAYAEDWAAAWNRLDVEHVAFSSPAALAVVGVATVHGKQALREYWTRALARIASLRFTVDRVLWVAGTRELAIIYDSEIGGRRKRVSENLVSGRTVSS